MPTGGDNPAHPVLMNSLAESFFQHGKIIHYSYDFWGGFELFQFYFPLPYLLGATLSLVFHPTIAFKLISIGGVFLLPYAFSRFAISLGAKTWERGFASLLSIPFLFTTAHVMWGGNVFSALAGMIANSWGFLFFVLSFAELLKARKNSIFPTLACLFGIAAILSHFYAMILVALVYGVFLFQDFLLILKGDLRIKQLMLFYLSGLLMVLSCAGWLIPLVFYKQYSADFGGDWEINLNNTLTMTEVIFFSLAVVFGTFSLNKQRGVVFLFFVFCALVFLGNNLVSSTAFNNNRLWPGLYFSLYAVFLQSSLILFNSNKLLVRVGVFLSLLFLVPGQASFYKAASWAHWNYSGVETKPGGEEFLKVVKELKKLPFGRVSFESDDDNNARFGSVRAFELLPLLTEHEIVEGGIVNSATFPGVGYFLQCLTSNTCAGWPPGSIMPEKDILRAIDYMKALGVSYHIATSNVNRELFKKSNLVELLFDGKYLSLFRVLEPVSFVEVYESELPVFNMKVPDNVLLNLPRLDKLRHVGFIFDSSATSKDSLQMLEFFQFYNKEWQNGKRVKDRGFADRYAKRHKYLNTFLIGEDKIEDFFIADRGFDPDIFWTNRITEHSPLKVPLVSLSLDELKINKVGYKESFNEGKLQINTEPGYQYRYVDIEVSSHVPKIVGSDKFIKNFPERVTNKCEAQVKKSFNKLLLETNCLGKPHIIKYAYYPKWTSDVPLKRGSYGFTVIVPERALTTLEHRYQAVDLVGVFVTLGALIALFFLTFCCKTSIEIN